MIPNAVDILQDKLPPFASPGSGNDYLDQLAEALPDAVWMDAAQILQSHTREELYYRTDHHWKTLAAFYVYQAWADRQGYTVPNLSDYEITPVTDCFEGTIQSRLGIRTEGDTIELFLPKKKTSYTIYKSDSEETTNTIYDYDALAEYIQNRAGVFEGYAPEQAKIAKNGIIAINGRYVALLICPDSQSAKTAFSECFGEHAENSELVKTEDSYDSSAVLQAWESGDDSALSEMNRRILDAAKDVIRQETDDSMSDYEKELAIHDWITDWSSFDYSVFGRSSEDGFIPGSDTPYGVLVDRSAMCHGYSSTFQLFMDMLNIECITVYGTLGHTYFNVTSEYLRSGSIHHWDDASVPEAIGTDYAYGNH